MSIFLGNSEPSKIFVGSSEVASVRAGDTKVRPSFVPRLPSEYQEVEYIESHGGQAIETDVTALVTPFRVEVKYMKQNTSTSDQTLVGQRQIGKYVNIYNNLYENLRSNTASGTASGDDNIHTIITDSSAGLYKDGTLLVSGTSGDKASTYPLLIFAFTENSVSNAKWFASVRIYEVKITSASLYRYYIPCYRKSDGVIGMYEMITGTFCTNALSGSFTKGADVSIGATEKLIEVLVVGGGGGAGSNCGGKGGGGGGGGFISSNYLISKGSYPITIGNGGELDTSGGNTEFATFIAYGGGQGAKGVQNGADGGGGGSGGGGSYATDWGGSPRNGQGYSGGGGYTSGVVSYGGGGGGAGENGTRSYPSSSCNPKGGDGKCSCISGQCVWYSGGGAGANNAYGNGTNGCGSARYDCCGGGGSPTSPSSGKSGIVIIRYPSSSLSASGGTITTSGDYTVHTFASDGTLTVS